MLRVKANKICDRVKSHLNNVRRIHSQQLHKSTRHRQIRRHAWKEESEAGEHVPNDRLIIREEQGSQCC